MSRTAMLEDGAVALNDDGKYVLFKVEGMV